MKLRILLLNALCLTILLGCETERDTQPERINTSEINQFSMNDKLAVRTAEGVHLLMKHAEVRELIKNEVNRQFDGDYNVLLADLMRKPLTMNAGNGMHTGTFGTFLQDVLGDSNSDVSRMGINNYQKSLVDSLTQYYPLLQIAIPQLEDQDINDWDFENNPLPIAIVTQDKSQGSIPSILVNGTIGTISITQDPEELYLVVSSNERTIAIPNGGQNFQANIINPGLDCTGDPFMTDYNNDYILLDDYYDAQNDCTMAGLPNSNGGSGGGTTVSSCDRDSNNNKDRITGLKYKDMNKYRRDMDDDNGDDAWFNGGLEVHVEIRFGQANGSVSKLTKVFAGARGAWRECGFLWTNCNTIWYNTNTEIVTWDKNVYGDAMHYVWYEHDGGGTRTETIKWTSKIGSVPVEFTDSRVVNIEDDVLGESIVEYCDNTQGEGYTYQTDALFFKVGQ